MRSLFLSLMILSCLAAQSQVPNAAQNLKDQANDMGRSFKTGDVKTFVKYCHPQVVKMMGGDEKMSTYLSKSLAAMKTQGIVVESMTFGEPARLIPYNKQLQTTIPGHVVLKYPQGNQQKDAIMIAISDDQGKNWKFIDTTNKDMASIRKNIPGLSPELVLSK